MKPQLFKGDLFSDTRGKLSFNNGFDASVIKRIYCIENTDTEFIRAWTGHRIEQRWFAATSGKFEIKLIEIDNWDNPGKNLTPFCFELSEGALDIVHVPAGYVSSIQAIEEGSKLLVMADYLWGEVKDEYRFDKDYFEQ
ncbi:WxcM-like domain-containing protein [Flavobacterium cerinum]|uniref:WxcM-like domain-containing protein n=1 Tax=Flavobacterium cerinum TaxID=2502784 RepID=A0ABY5IWJ2_9FLAO|nr:WxcM-like domain-containing protein [Flavobacterium cerinum]UUC47024.1 WxcM-like domain-containing protein [Flavobacterium cerinum]